jgi:Tol biopolymer transport system component
MPRTLKGPNPVHTSPARRSSLAGLFALVLVAVVGIAAPAVATPPNHHDRNGLIVFTAATATGDPQLFTVRPDGSDLTQITHGAAQPNNSDWSPDGRHIVFGLGDDTSATIAVVRADGSRLRVLPQPDGVFDDQPSYSPDGRRIYFERYTEATNDDAIWSMKTDGTDQRRIVGPFPNGFVTDPNVSPDGRTMSFQGWDGTLVGPAPALEPAMGLFTFDLRSGTVAQIRPFTADETIKAAWAPSGRRIAVTENANHFQADTSANIVTVRPDGSGLRQVTSFDDPEMNAYLGSYSPDGEWLVFRLEDHGLFGLYRVHPDGTDQEAILPLSSLRPSLIDWGTAAGRVPHPNSEE